MVRYFNKNIMISPRKLRLMVDQVRKMSLIEAASKLKFTNNKSARILVTSIETVISDAKNNFSINTDSLKFDTIKVDEGLKIKRMDKSHGSRFNRGIIQKRHSRLTIVAKGVVNN